MIKIISSLTLLIQLLLLSCVQKESFNKNSVNNKVEGPKFVSHDNTSKKIKKYHIKVSDNNKNFFGNNMAYFLPHEDGLFKGWKVTITAKKAPVYVNPFHNKKFASNIPQLDGVNKAILLKKPGTSLIITYVGGDYLSVVLNGEISYEDILDPEEIQSIEDPIEIPPIDLLSPPEEVSMEENLPTTITFNFENNTEEEITCQISELSHVEIVTPCTCGETSCSVEIKGERNYEGEGGFKYTLSSSSGEDQTEPGLVSLTINSGNDTPLTTDSTLDPADEDTLTTIILNYNDAEFDLAQTCSIFDLVNIEEVIPCICEENGICSVSFRGLPNFNGEGSFKYNVTANDLTSNDSTLSFELSAVNDAPETQDMTALSLLEDTPSQFTLAYTDVEGDPALTCDLENLVNVSLIGSCACAEGICSATLLPTADYYGPASFNFSVSAGVLVSNSSLATLDVLPSDDAPLANAVGPIAFNEDTSTTVTLSYFDKESHLATDCSVSNPTHMTFQNACSCNEAGVCSITIDSEPDYFGSGSFDFQVTANGLESNSASVALTLLPVEDLPVASDISASQVTEDTPQLITLQYTDADSDLATSCNASNLSNVLISTPCTCNGAGVCTIGVQGTLNFYGDASFNYSVTTNGSSSNVASVSFSVISNDDSPVAINFSPIAIDEDTQTTITLQYSDIEGDLATSCETSNLTGITITEECSCDSLGVCTVGVAGNSNFYGTASFNFSVNANGLTSNLGVMSLTVNPVDDPPEALDLNPVAVNEDTLSTITLFYIERDSDKATSCTISNLNGLSIINPCSCNAAGVCSVGVQGIPNHFGASSFQYTVTANGVESNIGTANLTLNAVDDAPIADDLTPAAFDEEGSLAVEFSYSDAESHLAATCSLSNLVGVSIINDCSCDSSGVCSADFQGNLNFNGAASFKYSVTANGLESNIATVNFTINPVDDLPIANDIALSNINEDAVTVVNLSYSDADNDQATSCSLSNLVNFNTIGDCTCTSGNCSVSVAPYNSYSGPASFEYVIFTGIVSSNAASAQFNVLNVQDPPVTQDITPPAFDEDSSSVITLSYTDEENDLATHCEVSNLNHVTESIGCSCDSSGICSVEVSGSANFNGTASFNYTVTSNSQVSNSAVATLTLNSIDDPTIASNLNPSNINDDDQLAVTLSYTDLDGDKATTCTVSNLVGVSEFSSCSCSTSGVCTVTVKGNPSFSGPASFDYFVTANGINSNTASVNFNIIEVDDVPETFNMTPDAFDEDIATEINLSYFDLDGDLATTCTVSNLESVRVIVPCACDSSGICTVTVRGTSNYFGPASFTYSVTANGVESNTSAASLTINSVDDPIPTEFTNFDTFQIAFTDDGSLFSSSYNIISLPHDASMPDGWKVTIRAENGPLFIYPTHNTTVSTTAPRIDGSNKFVILTTPGTVAEFYYEEGQFTTGLLTGSKTYSIFKDDAPTSCPTGMIPVPGSYLLETDGFCVTQSYYSPSSTVPNTFFATSTTCENLRTQYEGGRGSILNLNQYQTILTKSLSYRAGADQVLNSTERTAFFNQYPSYTSIYRSSKTCESNVNCNYYQTDGKIYIDSTNYISQKTGCSRTQNCTRTCATCNCYPSSCSYYQIEAYEMLKPGENLNFLIPSSCGNTSAPSTSVNLNIVSPSAGGTNALSYPVASDFHISEKNPNCQFSKFNLFSPVFNQTTAISHYSNMSSVFTTTNTNQYVVSHLTNISKTFAFTTKTASMGSPAYYRCAYTPGRFRCDLPADTTGYDTTNCQASSSNLLTKNECQISCAAGHTTIMGQSASKNCTPPDSTSDEGVFTFSGCYPTTSASDNISSCESATTSGLYSVDLIAHNGNISEDIVVYCEVHSDGRKTIDVVKSIAYAKDGGYLEMFKSLFFISNNTSSITIDSLSNSEETNGILVRNLGENLTRNSNNEFVTGFHIHQLGQTFNAVTLSYRMQGTRDDVNSCSTTSWVPLSGPGYVGSTSSYLSPALTGYTSIQGTPTLSRDAPILVSSYNNTSILPTNVLSFSGAGLGSVTLVNQACELDPLIPYVDGNPKPATFITELHLQDTNSKRCSIPASLPTGYNVSCGSTPNDDHLYFTGQCSVSCVDGYSDTGKTISCATDESEFTLSGCTAP